VPGGDPVRDLPPLQPILRAGSRTGIGGGAQQRLRAIPPAELPQRLGQREAARAPRLIGPLRPLAALHGAREQRQRLSRAAKGYQISADGALGQRELLGVLALFMDGQGALVMDQRRRRLTLRVGKSPESESGPESLIGSG
jgi:hypothetical protein